MNYMVRQSYFCFCTFSEDVAGEANTAKVAIAPLSQEYGGVGSKDIGQKLT
jgi:hypothetical protein